MNNTTKQLLVISSFPRKNEIHGQATVGVASYTKNVLLSLLSYAKIKRKKLDVTVFAEVLESASVYGADHGMTIERNWQRNNVISLLRLIRQTVLFPADTVFISFEFAMFGDTWTLIPFLILLVTCKLNGKHVVVALHQVVEDVTTLSGHLDIMPHTIRTDVTNAGIAYLYKAVAMLTSNIIVFEDTLKNYLTKLTNKECITVIPHGVETVKPIAQTTARKQLGIPHKFTILCFGYIAWYKGTDWIVNYIRQYAKRMKTPIRLIIAGGPNPNRTPLRYYRRYVHRVKQLAQESGGTVTVTGYVPEQQIASYFAASDLVVLPYRTMMSASGPLALAQATGKPYLLSEALAPALKTHDVEQVLTQYKISEHQLTFALNETDLIHRIKTIQTNRKLRTRLTTFSRLIGKSRTFSSISSKWWEELMENDCI